MAGTGATVTGTGPFKLARYVRGNSQRYVKNPDYWDRGTHWRRGLRHFRSSMT